MVWFRKLWVSGDERPEREQAGGSAQRLRVRADLRGQGRRLDARRRPTCRGSEHYCFFLHYIYILLPILKICDVIVSSASSLILVFSFQDVRRIMQAPSDHERIRSHWPRSADMIIIILTKEKVQMKFSRVVTWFSCGLHPWICSIKGHGEMQEQKLRRRWKLASQHHGWMQEEPISIAFAALLVSVSYSSLLSKPLYLLINEVILVCQLFYLCQFVSKRVSQCSSLILSYTEERSHEHVPVL